jgi:hypothetical protein
MGETLGQVLGYINQVLPNSVDTTTLITFINDELKENWSYLTSTEYYQFQLSSGVPIYPMPTNVTMDMINENGLLVSDTTSVPTSTAEWNSYTFKGADEELDGNNYVEALDDIGIYPIPDNGYYARIIYQEYPTIMASTDTNTQFNISDDYIKLIKFRTLARVAKSGKFPRVDLANNYDADAMQIERKMKVNRKNDKTKTNRTRFDWREWRW